MWGKNVRILFLTLSFSMLLISELVHTFQKDHSQDSKNKLQGKIVNGVMVSIKKYPFASQFVNMGRLCGGAIIHSWAIITSAHCLVFSTNIKEMKIITGARFAYDYDSTMYKVSSFVVHEDYNKEQAFARDIALVFTKKRIQFGPSAQKAVLVNHDKWMDENETNFIVTGWGYTQENGPVSKVSLLMTSLKYVAPRDCSQFHDNYKLTEDMFCLYGGGISDVCQGDSGGGVLWNDVLVGLTSHGSGCARKGKPSVYTNLWILRSWIKEHILEFYDNFCKNNRSEEMTLDKNEFDNTYLFA